MANEKPLAAMILGILAGLIFIGSATIELFAASIAKGLSNTPGVSFTVSGLVTEFGAIGIVIGVLTLIMGILAFAKPQYHLLAGILLIVFSLLSFVFNVLGGFLIGFILALIAGILAIVFKPTKSTGQPVSQEDSFNVNQ